MFRHFEPELIIKTLHILMIGLKTDQALKGYSCSAINAFCTFIYQTLNKTTEKNKLLKERIE